MILDALSSSSRYEALGPRFAQAFRWLRMVNPAHLADGRTELDGDNVYVLVERDLTRPLSKVKWEAHKKYAAIHYMVEGLEAVFWEVLSQTKIKDYDEDTDTVRLDADTWVDLELPAGQFAVFFPEDAHRPGIEVPGSEPVCKLIVMVKL